MRKLLLILLLSVYISGTLSSVLSLTSLGCVSLLERLQEDVLGIIGFSESVPPPPDVCSQLIKVKRKLQSKRFPLPCGKQLTELILHLQSIEFYSRCEEKGIKNVAEMMRSKCREDVKKLFHFYSKEETCYHQFLYHMSSRMTKGEICNLFEKSVMCVHQVANSECGKPYEQFFKKEWDVFRHTGRRLGCINEHDFTQIMLSGYRKLSSYQLKHHLKFPER